MRYLFPAALIALPLSSFAVECTPVSGEAWVRHSIDNTSQGADGARLADVNADGWVDVVTPWEQGGVIRLYLHPGPERVREPWPQVTVGTVPSPEDAVCADVDGDGALDVISCTEGEDRSIYIHWGPVEPDAYLTDSAWKTDALPAAKQKRQWMFAAPAQIDDRYGVDLFAGAKNEGAAFGWFEAPEDARDLDRWQWHSLRRAGWAMSLLNIDMNEDNHWDLVFSDRRGQFRGCWWLRHPGSEYLHEDWPATRMAGFPHEVMFMAPADLDADGERDFVAATSGGPVLRFERAPSAQQRANEEVWLNQEITMPENTGTGKSAAAGDIDNDGTEDIVVSCEKAEGSHGVFWMRYQSVTLWEAKTISGLEGTKFDLITLQDLDFDGDLDVITCEEAENLGVIWYENPYGPRLVPIDPATGLPAEASVEGEAEGEVVDGEKEGKKDKSLIRRLFN